MSQVISTGIDRKSRVAYAKVRRACTAAYFQGTRGQELQGWPLQLAKLARGDCARMIHARYTAGLQVRADLQARTHAAVQGIWIGNFGDYPIPERFASLRMRHDGQPDRRQNPALLAEFEEWLDEQERAHGQG